jgi:hypothetical protein
MKIGDLLLLKGVINKKQLQSALRKQSEEAINYGRSVPLGKILIEKKYVTVDEIADILNQQSKEVVKEKKEEKVMPTEIGEGSKFTFDLKFIVTIGVVIVSACGLYFSITGQVEDNTKEIEVIKSNGDLKLITYQLNEFKETFGEIKSLAIQLRPLAIKLDEIKIKMIEIENKTIDLSGIDDCKDKLDALSNKISAFEDRLTKLEKRNSSGGRF